MSSSLDFPFHVRSGTDQTLYSFGNRAAELHFTPANTMLEVLSTIEWFTPSAIYMEIIQSRVLPKNRRSTLNTPM